MTVQHAHEIVLSPEATRMGWWLVAAAVLYVTCYTVRTFRFLDR